ncbi:MAG: hypothetical protein LBB73_07755 [Dysgonamonadaceae bacterium]|jgi:hypothetical protein|nr:hypothetical protein [Dysgonamonadaceae bacterium]
MKRLITVLISFIGYSSLFGQGLPVVVAGKMYVGAKVRSQGAVHVYANSSATTTADEKGVGKINMATGESVLQADTIIFYSNDKNDGLLLNTDAAVKATDGTTAPKAVILRKKFEPAKHTYFSLPFDVMGDSIFKAGTRIKLRNGEDNDWQFLVYEFDYENRANSGFTSAEQVWKELGSASAIDRSEPDYQKLSKGIGYQFYLGDESFTDVDFYAVSSDIAKLFSTNDNDKILSYPVYKGDANWNNLDKVSGWAFLGGLNSSTFLFSKSNLGSYDGRAVYYQYGSSSQALNPSQWKEVVLGSDETAQIGPFTPFYVHNSVDELNKGGTKSNTLMFKKAGLLLTSAQYRSSQNESGAVKDRLYFALSSGKDNTFFDRFYLDFAEDYAESFHTKKDAIKMASDYPNMPTVWSLRDGSSLVVNGLSTPNERIVPVGFSVPEAGDYTISLDPLLLTDVRNVVLVDNQTKAKVDLLQSLSYSFQSEKVTSDNERFTLYINSTYTGTPAVKAGDPFAFVKNNILTVSNLSEGDKVQVLDLTGRTVASGKASGKEFSVPLIRKGIYVVSTGGKASILKVLNK